MILVKFLFLFSGATVPLCISALSALSALYTLHSLMFPVSSLNVPPLYVSLHVRVWEQAGLAGPGVLALRPVVVDHLDDLHLVPGLHADLVALGRGVVPRGGLDLAARRRLGRWAFGLGAAASLGAVGDVITRINLRPRHHALRSHVRADDSASRGPGRLRPERYVACRINAAAFLYR